jgi:hypothetical protein
MRPTKWRLLSAPSSADCNMDATWIARTPRNLDVVSAS